MSKQRKRKAPAKTNVIALAKRESGLRARLDDLREVYELFVRTRGELTVRTHRTALVDFARWLGRSDPGDAAAHFLSLEPGEANALALAYQADLRSRPVWRSKVDREAGKPPDRKGLAPATIKLRIAALRSLAKLGRQAGKITWKLEITDLKARTFRDTAGPGRDAYFAMLGVLDREASALAGSSRGEAALRDRAMLRLLHDLGLRRAEVLGLDLDHVDLRGKGRVTILGKGQDERVPVTLSTRAKEALKDWIAVRGRGKGPLFVSYHHRYRGRRLTLRAVNYLLGELAKKAGIDHVTPHGFRHTAITTALDRTGGNIRAVQRFSRHASVTMVQQYDDDRRDRAGEIAELISDDEDDSGTR